MPSLSAAAFMKAGLVSPQEPASASLSAGWDPRMSMSGSGKRSSGCPICTPESAILSARRTRQDKICTPPVISRNFFICIAVLTEPVSPNLHLCASLDTASFLFHRARRILFSARGKENGGCIPIGKAYLENVTPSPRTAPKCCCPSPSRR